MTNVVQFRSGEESYEEAALWLARLDRGLSEADNGELARWLHAEPRHSEALLELAVLWDQLDVLSELSTLFPLDQPAAKKQRSKWTQCALAASLVGVAIAVWITHESALHVDTDAEMIAGQSVSKAFETTIGGRAREDLPDGSVVMLNTDTALEVTYSDASRDVFLSRGEAHFDVVSDEAHPFRVHVGARIVEAVGTAFNVELGVDGRIEVTVTEGKVKVVRAAESSDERRSLPLPVFEQVPQFEVDTALVEGEVAILDQSVFLDAARPQIAQLDPVEVDMKLAWQRGMLIFQGEPLREMLSEVARYTTTEFVLEDDELGDLRVGGYFKAGDIDGLLLSLHNGFNITSERVGNDRIVLRAAP
jgi:transmembrane sensor